jgi:hypothetical protein
MSIDYTDAGFPVRSEFAESHQRFWQRLQRAGTWCTAEQRIAIASEVRLAKHCSLCDTRVDSLSPRSNGEHRESAVLSASVIEVVHAIVRDASRISKSWYQNLLAGGLTEGEYIEIVGTVVSMVSIDSFADAIGVAPRALPEFDTNSQAALAVSRYTPETAGVTDQAWVPMVDANNAGTPEADLWPSERTGNVIRAMSLVPDEVRTLNDLSAAHYLPMALVPQAGVDAGRALHRSQMELVAGRVSALNACYY